MEQTSCLLWEHILSAQEGPCNETFRIWDLGLRICKSEIRNSQSQMPLHMKAMILAAGRGTRLRPLTEHVPKCMIPINGRPLLEYTIEWLRRYGVTHIAMNVCHLGDVIMAHFGDGSRWGVNITYSVEEEPLGTAGGVKNIEWFFDGGPFLVWYGDNLSTCRLHELLQFHEEKEGAATIALHYREDPTQSGIVGLDENDRITRFLEKPGSDQVFSHWVNAGIYVLEPQVLASIPAEGAPDFGRDTFPQLLARGESLYGYRMSSEEKLWWIDTPEALHRVETRYIVSLL